MPAESFPMKEAHRVLVRLRLDTTVLHLRLERGILTLNGRVCYPDIMGEGQRNVNYELLHEMHRQLRLINGVKGVEYQLKNFLHTGDGGWSKRRFQL